MENNATAYPLKWPEGWNRTLGHQRANYSRFNTTFDRARRELDEELRKLGAQQVVVSSWLPIRKDGKPYSDQARRRLEDPGVAVYFTLKGRQMVMARDAYSNVHDNLRSIGLGIAHLRGLERHGGGTMMERAFEGFAALPAPDVRDPWAILGMQVPYFEDDVQTKFRELSKRHHPDVGGSVEAFQEIQWARDEALKRLAL